MEAPGERLGAPGERLGAPRGAPGSSWRRLGSAWERVGSAWERLGAPGERLGAPHTCFYVSERGGGHQPEETRDSPETKVSGFRVLLSLRIIAACIDDAQFPEGGQPRAAWATHSGNPLASLEDAMSFVDNNKDMRRVGRCTTRCVGI